MKGTLTLKARGDGAASASVFQSSGMEAMLSHIVW